MIAERGCFEVAAEDWEDVELDADDWPPCWAALAAAAMAMRLWWMWGGKTGAGAPGWPAAAAAA